MMKRFLLLTIAAVFASALLSAQDCVTVKSGDVAFLSEKSGISLEINYDKTMVGEVDLMTYLKSRGEDYLEDWPRDEKKGFDFFTEEFNRKNKDFAQIRNTQKIVLPKYRMVFDVLFLDMGNSTMKNVPFISKSGGDTISGFITVIEAETGNEVCVLAVDEVNGQSFPSDGERLGMAMAKVARLVCSLRPEE